jgi:hypothetical protein
MDLAGYPDEGCGGEGFEALRVGANCWLFISSMYEVVKGEIRLTSGSFFG